MEQSPALYRTLPSGLKASPMTGPEWAANTSCSFRPRACQMRMLPSSQPTASRRELRLKQAERTSDRSSGHSLPKATMVLSELIIITPFTLSFTVLSVDAVQDGSLFQRKTKTPFARKEAHFVLTSPHLSGLRLLKLAPCPAGLVAVASSGQFPRPLLIREKAYSVF